MKIVIAETTMITALVMMSAIFSSVESAHAADGTFASEIVCKLISPKNESLTLKYKNAAPALRPAQNGDWEVDMFAVGNDNATYTLTQLLTRSQKDIMAGVGTCVETTGRKKSCTKAWSTSFSVKMDSKDLGTFDGMCVRVTVKESSDLGYR